MGASGWNYFTPYKPNVADALEELRQRVFTNKEYGDRALDMGMGGVEAMLAQLPPAQQEQMNAALQQFKAARASQAEAATIDELLEQSAEPGTHSILDICAGISKGPDFGTAFPMPDAVMLDLYGTTTPTHEQVEAKAHERSEELDRWQCWYVIVHKNGQPDEVYFEGCSGD